MYTKPILYLPIKKSRWKIHCTTVILNTIFSFIWIKTTGAKHNPCRPGSPKTLILAFKKTIPFLSGFLYKTSLIQGSLQIRTEYFHHIHFMKLQLRGEDLGQNSGHFGWIACTMRQKLSNHAITFDMPRKIYIFDVFLKVS